MRGSRDRRWALPLAIAIAAAPGCSSGTPSSGDANRAVLYHCEGSTDWCHCRQGEGSAGLYPANLTPCAASTATTCCATLDWPPHGHGGQCDCGTPTCIQNDDGTDCTCSWIPIQPTATQHFVTTCASSLPCCGGSWDYCRCSSDCSTSDSTHVANCTTDTISTCEGGTPTSCR